MEKDDDGILGTSQEASTKSWKTKNSPGKMCCKVRAAETETNAQGRYFYQGPHSGIRLQREPAGGPQKEASVRRNMNYSTSP